MSTAIMHLAMIDVVGFPLWLVLGSWSLSALFLGIMVGKSIHKLNPTNEGEF